MSTDERNPDIFVLFPSGDKFPVRYYRTSDCYTVELPSGIYENEYISDLKRDLSREFDGIRITK